jgi:2-iminobutanoate/2-iminopropanoate deaminase
LIYRLRTAQTRAMKLPFSDAVRVGKTLYVSGQIGHRPGTLQLVPGGIVAESRQALSNMQAVLEHGGSSLAHVVKCTIFLADIAEWSAFNTVYCEVFGEELPARSALGANGLALGARVELDCIAVIP